MIITKREFDNSYNINGNKGSIGGFHYGITLSLEEVIELRDLLLKEFPLEEK